MEKMTREEKPHEWSQFLCIVRDPYDRLISCWENKGEYFKQDTFEDFVEYVCRTPDGVINPHAQSQTSFIDKPIARYIRFDSLQQDFLEIGIKVLCHLNKGGRKKPALEYYNADTLLMVQERYEEDFDLWDKVCLKRAAS